MNYGTLERAARGRALRIIDAPRAPQTRRAFLRSAGALAAVAWTGRGNAFARRASQNPGARLLDLARIARFVDPLPILPRAEAAPIPGRSAAAASASRHVRIAAREIDARLHRDLPPTRVWSFGMTFPGPTIEARRGEPLSIEWVNALPPAHFLPIDRTIHGAEGDAPDTRLVVHVHGARVRPEYDGHPDQWIGPGHSAVYHYTNGQDAATLWYHDHTMGLNRLNVYAGLVGAYLIRDAEEDALHLPAGPHELVLVLCDRQLDAHGQLVYPVSDDPKKPWVPEVYGDALLINGKLFPYLDVEPRPYRLRLINASNAKFLRLTLSDRTPFQHIGTDQGLLRDVVSDSAAVLAPAERADAIVDFSQCAGQTVTLDDHDLPAMQLRVAAGRAAASWRPPARLRAIERLPESTAARVRVHKLGEMRDMVQQPMQMLLNDTPWHMPVTEIAELDTIEIWNLVNLTDDAHPIHLHLVRFQVIDRRKVDKFEFQNTRTLRYTGPAEAPDPAELGWKDTVRAYAGMATRIIVKFEGFTGRYMWHCHVLEHGDNEMMRPVEIVPKGARA